MRRLSKWIERLFDGANPTFALTVRMETCRRKFFSTAIFYALGVAAIFFVSKTSYPASLGLSGPDFFEIMFLVATCCSVVFLGCDFGPVFIESTFQDELFRLTPLTPLDIVHGGICSSLFFSSILLLWTMPFIGLASFQFSVQRIFYGTLLLFVIGQALNLVLISCYIHAKNWKQIGMGAVTAFILILLFAGFCFTGLGRLLFSPDRWNVPMLFLLVSGLLTGGIAYFLARNHALSPHRTFRRTVRINLAVYVPFLILVSLSAVLLSVYVE